MITFSKHSTVHPRKCQKLRQSPDSWPRAAASDPIMTVYEAHRKNVFLGRLGPSQAALLRWSEALHSDLKAEFKSKDHFSRIIHFLKHIYSHYTWHLDIFIWCSILKHFKGHNCDFVATQAWRDTVTLPCKLYIKVDPNSFQQHFPHNCVFRETIQNSLEHW